MCAIQRPVYICSCAEALRYHLAKDFVIGVQMSLKNIILAVVALLAISASPAVANCGGNGEVPCESPTGARALLPVSWNVFTRCHG